MSIRWCESPGNAARIAALSADQPPTPTKGEAVFGGKTLNLSKVTIPVYHLVAREDHTAPAKLVFISAKFFGGEIRYVLAGSGHIAGISQSGRQAKISILVARTSVRRVRGLVQERNRT